MKPLLYMIFCQKLDEYKIPDKITFFKFDFEKTTTTLLNEEGNVLKKEYNINTSFSKMLLSKAAEQNATLLYFLVEVNRNRKKILLKAKLKNNKRNEIMFKTY